MRTKQDSKVLHLSDGRDALLTKEQHAEVRAIAERDAIPMSDAYYQWEEGDHV